MNASFIDYLKQPVYLVLIVFAAAIVFLMLRTWWRKQKIRLQQINDEDFGKLDKNYSPNRLKELKSEYPGLEEALTWMDSRLMENSKANEVSVELRQIWCCEDRTGEAEYPMGTRPSEIAVEADGKREVHPIQGFLEEDSISQSDARILRWALYERLKLLVPFKVYRVHTDKTCRKFTPKEGVATSWLEDEVVKEDYRIEATEK